MLLAALMISKLYLPEDTGMFVQEVESSEMLEEEIEDAAAGVEREDIAGGTDKNITWRIDADGKLMVEGTGDFSSLSVKPWDSEREKIKSAVVRVTGLKNASYMFCHCSNLRSVDLSGFDTSSVTDMRAMFYDCSWLTSVDLSSLDTHNVTE
ncbi:MAG: DUF285 domain-containing protein, partial [Acetatifactor sp.]|nr:DUF285 domain-containing protein [Acetatifactor sp.]